MRHVTFYPDILGKERVDLLVNNQILAGSYEIERLLGSGGMGNVYLARDIRQGGRVAVKERIGGSDGADELLREAEILGKLRHKGLPRLRKAFRERGSVYLVMDYVEGNTLKALLAEEGCLIEEQALFIAGELAELLTYLHGLRPPVYYLDLKPSNILMDKEGNVRLIDFGAARENGGSGQKSHVSLTRGYAAPEQYLDGRIDERTDLYALGVTLHFLLTGKNPNEPPFLFEDVRKLNPKITKNTADLVRRLIEPVPAQRMQSAEELLSMLRKPGKRRLSENRKKGKRLFFGVTAAAAALIFVIMGGSVGAEDKGGGEICFSLAPGSYEGYQLLSIDFDREEGKLYYTTDGSEPTRESEVYLDGIVLSRPEVRVRVKLFSFDGKSRDESAEYRISSEQEVIEIDRDSEVAWDIYYALGKKWTEPLHNYELAEIRSLPGRDLTEENEWLIKYMPFLRNAS